MEKLRPKPGSDSRAHARRRAQRVLVLGTLRDICLQIGRLQRSADGRGACREVAGLLDRALAREKAAERKET